RTASALRRWSRRWRWRWPSWRWPGTPAPPRAPHQPGHRIPGVAAARRGEPRVPGWAEEHGRGVCGQDVEGPDPDARVDDGPSDGLPRILRLLGERRRRLEPDEGQGGVTR